MSTQHPDLAPQPERTPRHPTDDASRPGQRWLPPLLLVPDLLLLYAGLVVGFKVRFGQWLLPHATEWGWAVPIVLAVYAAALAASGVYRMHPRTMHLPEFSRGALGLLGAWVLSIAFTYTVRPDQLPPRSVMAVHGLFAIVGVLGLRALLRQGFEWVRPTSPVPQPTAPAPVRLADLVPRDPVSIDTIALRDYLSDRTVLVTGAGGSIGTELCEQLLALRPFRLVLVDVSEYNLYRLENALRKESYGGDIEFCIADVREEEIMDGLFTSFHPSIVLHTAAYKHVPLMERHPAESFRNNTLSTVHLLRLSEAHDVEQFIFVSTDKAVEPTSVLGATKRLAEWYVQAATSEVKRKIVRFGNVFGSQGSVVPFFEKRLAGSEPLPITHPDMERYFMSAHEACGLILQTLLYDEYPIYIFRMGEPICIQWLAEQLIARQYPHVPPHEMIEYVGRRPGEKLSEQLTTPGETVHPLDHPSIVGLHGAVPYSRTELELHFRRLEALCRNPSTAKARIRRALFETHLDPTSRDVHS